MDEKKEPSQHVHPKKVKYLNKMKDFLKSLRDLEEDLEDALSDLGGQPGKQPTPMPPGPPTYPEYREPEPPRRHHEEHHRDDDRYDHRCDHHDDHHDHDDHHHDDDRCDHHHHHDDRCDHHHHHPCPPPDRPCGTQIIVNGTLTLPSQKPDIETIIRFKPYCKVTDWQCVHTVDGRKIVVTGLVEIHMEYVANLPDQPMHFAHFVVPFHTFFLCDKPIEAVRCEVEFVHQEMLDPRTISKVILLRVSGVER